MAQAPTEQRQQNDLAAFSFEDRLALLVERQWLWRENRSLAIRLKNAQLKISASLEDLDYRSSRGLKRAQIDQLRTSSWVFPFIQFQSIVTPAKPVGTRVKVSPVKLGCSRRDMTSTVSPRGGVRSCGR